MAHETDFEIELQIDMQRDGLIHLVGCRQHCAIVAKQLTRRLASNIERKPTHYEILGIEKDAKIAEIKEAYVKLSKQYHPDRDVNNKSLHGVFIKVNEAYTVLSDKERRKEYDSVHGLSPVQASNANAQNPFGTNNYSTSADAWYDEKYEQELRNHHYFSNSRRNYQFANTTHAKGRKFQNMKFFVYLIAYTAVGSGLCFAMVKFSHKKYKEYVDRVSAENGRLYEGIVKQARDNGPWEQLNLFKEKVKQQQDPSEKKE